MATVTQSPDSLSLVENIKAFKISSTVPVTFKLCDSEENTVIEESYRPDASGVVVIDVREVCMQFLSASLPTTNLFLQPGSMAEFTAYVDDVLESSFTVVLGGVRGMTGQAETFLAANWLTWQPQTKAVRWNQPEYITYHHTVAGNTYAQFYKKDGTTKKVRLRINRSGDRVTYNMMMSYLFSRSGEETRDLYGLVDVWVENLSGTRLSYIQRYTCHPETRDEHYFVCVNSLGGIDTFCFCGDRALTPSMNHVSAQNSEQRIDVSQEHDRSWTQDTGYLSQLEAKWAWEFFSSSRRWAIVDDSFEEIILDSSSIQASDADNITSFNFSFSLAKGGRLLSLQRNNDDLPLIEVPSPSGDLFFLAPRIVDFESATLSDTLLFITQSPFVQEWQKISLGEICDFISDYLLETSWGQLAHTHSNKSVLDRFSEDADHELLFDGHAIGGGVSDYDNLFNKPCINGVQLSGNMTAADLGLVGNDLFEKVTIGEDLEGNPIYAIKAKYAFYSVGQVSASGIGAGGGGEGTGVDWIQYAEEGVGTHIANIIIDGVTQEVWAPSGGGAGYLSQLGDVQLGTLGVKHLLLYSNGHWTNQSFDSLVTEWGLLSEYSDATIRGNWTFNQSKALQFYDNAGHAQIYGSYSSSQGYVLNLYGADRINLSTRAGGKVYVNGIEITGGGGGGGGSYTLPVATVGALGGIKVGYSDSDKKLGLQLDSSSDKAYVELTSQAIVAALGYTPDAGTIVSWTQYVPASQGVEIAQITINGVTTGVYAPVSGGGYTLPVASELVRGGIKTGFENTFNYLGLRMAGENAYILLTSEAVIAALGYTPSRGNFWIGQTQVQTNPGVQDLIGIRKFACTEEVKIGNIRMVYDQANNAVKLIGPDGEDVNLIVSGQSSAGID